MKKSFTHLLETFKSYTRAEKMFILFVMLCSMCITSDHAIVKPISYSVFIANFSASGFPYAWLVMLPINFAIIFLYNKVLPYLGCFKTTLALVVTIITVHVVSTLVLSHSPMLSFFYFIWKDIYVLLMFQQLWSVVHSTISAERAKYLYGIIYGVGGVGAIMGSCIPGFFATKMGSESLLLIVGFIYLFFILFYRGMLTARKQIPSAVELPTKPTENTAGGFQLIYRSKQLRFILMIVVFMQLASTLIDFAFNTYLEAFIPHKDLRTEYAGRVFGVIHGVNLLLQFFGAFIIMQVLGVRRSHLFIPLIFAVNLLGFMIFPLFGLMTLCFSMIKAFDYSIFSILKEMLYLPLNIDEKFKAKAVIDVFAYRSSKALASFAILSLQFFHLTAMLSWILLGIFFLWLGATFYMFKRADLKTA